MTFLRALLIGLLAVALPLTALAGALERDHCRMDDAPAQDASAPMDHSMHAGHAMDADASGEAQAPAADGCQCGCDCSNEHCTSTASVFVSASLGGELAGARAAAHALPRALARVTAAHHLDLLRPPAGA